MALDVEVQRLQLFDVVMADLPDDGAKVEATVMREISRRESTVLVTLRVAGHEDFVREWDLGELITVVRGP